MLNKADEQFLELYSDSEYEKPSVTVDAVLLRIKSEQSSNYRKLPEKKLQVYLTKRKYPPFADKYAVIGTFIDLNYELSETMKMCVKKKINLSSNFYYEQLFTFGEKARDPRTRVLSIAYMLLTQGQDDLENGEWFDIDILELDSKIQENQNGYSLKKTIKITLSNSSEQLENIIQIKTQKRGLEETKSLEILDSNLAFDHIKIIYYALERLKNKLEYTDIVFNMLPKEFTLTELKQCYELILDEKLLDANFRRKIAKLVKPINKFETARGHRTSQLYEHNPNWKQVNLD